MTSDSYTFILVLVDMLQDLHILPNLPTIADARLNLLLISWSHFYLLRFGCIYKLCDLFQFFIIQSDVHIHVVLGDCHRF